MAESNGRERLHGDSGEGVISAAIAIVIMEAAVGLPNVCEGVSRRRARRPRTALGGH
jgi:hypothetical protein